MRRTEQKNSTAGRVQIDVVWFGLVYQHNGVPSCNRQQVCAGNGSRALSFQLLLDLVDQLETFQRVDVLLCLLLSDQGCRVVEQH